jgi:hypothetical protein
MSAFQNIKTLSSVLSLTGNGSPQTVLSFTVVLEVPSFIESELNLQAKITAAPPIGSPANVTVTESIAGNTLFSSTISVDASNIGNISTFQGSDNFDEDAVLLASASDTLTLTITAPSTVSYDIQVGTFTWFRIVPQGGT